MALTFVQKKSSGSDGTKTKTTTFDSAPTSGNLLIAVFQVKGARTLNTPDGWSVATMVSLGSPSGAIFYKVAGAGESSNVTCSFSALEANSTIGLHIYEFSGNSATPFDGGNNASGSGATHTTGQVNTTNANDLLVIGYNVQDTTTGWSNYSVPFQDTDEQFDVVYGSAGARMGCSSAYDIISSTGSYNISATGPNASYLGMIVALKEASAVGWTHKLFGIINTNINKVSGIFKTNISKVNKV